MKKSWAIVPLIKKGEVTFLVLTEPVLEEQINLKEMSSRQTEKFIKKNFSQSVSEISPHFQMTHFPYDLCLKLQNINLYHSQFSSDAIGEKIINLKFENVDRVTFSDWKSWKKDKIKLFLKKDLEFSDYKKKFDICRKNLLLGNCYQLNLSEKFSYHFTKSVRALDFVLNLWSDKKNIGSFGHATWIASHNQLLLSNSPECLFQIVESKGEYKVVTMPIKGTQKIRKTIGEAWKKLVKSKKDFAELNMITDLLRNDLSRINIPNGKIVKKRMPLVVPGLVHQFSIIESILPKEIPLYKVILSLFPGGSITGAPKKNVISKLYQLEKRSRGHYSGSTLIQYKKIKCCNINIRTADVDMDGRVLSYSSGGGVTLLSSACDEYSELLAKRDSFINIF